MNLGIEFKEIVTYIIAAALLILVGYVMFKVLKISVFTISRIVVNTFIGGCAIYLGNYIFSYFGFSVGLNAVTAIFSGLMGIPGFVSLVVIKLLVGA